MAKETYRNPLERRTVVYRGGRYSVRLAGNETHTTDDDELKTAFRKSGFKKVTGEKTESSEKEKEYSWRTS